MTHSQSAHRAAQIVAVCLIATIVTQILYMVTLGGPSASDSAQGMTSADIAAYFTDRWSEVAIVWTVETVAFAGIALGSLVALTQSAGSRYAWAALALAGLFNLVQIGIGLSMFKPVALAGEELAPLFGVVVSGAFWFYFLAKAMTGLAAMMFGLWLFAGSKVMAAKALSGLAIVFGLAALCINVAGLGLGNQMIFLAGVSGTLAALFAALTCVMAAKRAGSA